MLGWIDSGINPLVSIRYEKDAKAGVCHRDACGGSMLRYPSEGVLSRHFGLAVRRLGRAGRRRGSPVEEDSTRRVVD
jgi:hypothetical protein